MKKAISIVLMFALCLSLCSIAYGSDTNYIIGTDDNSTDEHLDFSYSIDEKMVPIGEIRASMDESSVTVTAGELYDEYEISNTSIGVSSIKVSSADLVLVSITPNANQPFQAQADVPFTIQVENRGTVNAQNVMLTVIIGNARAGTVNCGTMEANRGYYLDLTLGVAAGGNYRVSMIINESRTIVESSYDNNSLSRSYRWAGFDGILAEKFEPADGIYTISPNTVKEFNFMVANLGNADANNVDVGYVVDAALKTTFSLGGTIPPGYAKTGTIGVKFGTPGERNVGILVDPNNRIPDPTRADNLLTVDVTIADLFVENRRNNVQIWGA